MLISCYLIPTNTNVDALTHAYTAVNLFQEGGITQTQGLSCLLPLAVGLEALNLGVCSAVQCAR